MIKNFTKILRNSAILLKLIGTSGFNASWSNQICRIEKRSWIFRVCIRNMIMKKISCVYLSRFQIHISPHPYTSNISHLNSKINQTFGKLFVFSFKSAFRRGSRIIPYPPFTDLSYVPHHPPTKIKPSFSWRQ